PMVELSIHDVALDDPARASALATTMLERARRRSRAFLCSYGLAGDVLALGRFHVVPAHPSSPVALLRRLTGGRLAPLGEGYVGLLLALPQGTSLARDDPPTLPPERILNRAVRGLLGALERLGVQAYYPGRDVITVGGRTIGVVGIEVAADGAVLVEACVALARSFAEVARFADRAGARPSAGARRMAVGARRGVRGTSRSGRDGRRSGGRAARRSRMARRRTPGVAPRSPRD